MAFHLVVYKEDENYMKAVSVGMLKRHFKKKHRELHDKELMARAEMKLKHEESSASAMQSSITSLITGSSNFEKWLLSALGHQNTNIKLPSGTCTKA